MKNSKRLLIIALSSILLFGCSIKDIAYDSLKDNKISAKNDSDSKNKNIPKGITVNKINFQVVNEEDLPANILNSVKTMKANKGFIAYDYDGYYYISVFSGKKNTAGYTIKVLSVEDNEDKANIIVEEKSPAKGSLSAQVITYPYTTIKVSGITTNINVKDREGKDFPRIIQDGEIY